MVEEFGGKVTSIIKRLKKQKEDCEIRVIILDERYTLAKDQLKIKEQILKEAKQLKYQCYREWREERLLLAQIDRKLKAKPSQVRMWNKKNFGKVMERFENG